MQLVKSLALSSAHWNVKTNILGVCAMTVLVLMFQLKTYKNFGNEVST